MNFFPIITRPTAFDVGDARVVALDLDEVARGGGVVGNRITAVMYMLARQVLAKDFYVNKESVGDMPAPPNFGLLRDTVPVAQYKSYHSDRIEQITKDPKRICYDEFHRTTNAQAVREQVVLDMREGRKFRVDVILASQSLEDFDDRMIEFCTSLFIMDGGNELTVAGIEKRFELQSETERWALRHRVRPPGKGGGIFLSKFETNQGKYTMLLSATLGPIELWAFSTTAEDAALRNKLYERLGPSRARRALALAYPSGSAKSDIDNRKEQMRESGLVLLDTAERDVVGQIVKEVAEMADKLKL
jgi:intracellular multiplication protein IcmB